MAKKEYDWHLGEAPPKIDLHSFAKHHVYEEYLNHYIQVLNSNPKIPAFRLTLIDGFAGGGVYLDPRDNSLYQGSPIRLIKSAEAAAAAVNITRQTQGIKNSFELQIEYYFIEKKKSNHEYLTWFLKEQGLQPRIDKDIFSIEGNFTNLLPNLLNKVKDNNANRRCIFLLDQYGWSKVPFQHIRNIFGQLPRAEVILTFATDWLIDYMSNNPKFLKTWKKTGLDQVLDLDRLLQHKNDSFQWRKLIQLELHRAIETLSGAQHYTPFFIVSEEANKSFWLVHLSNHPKARDVMTELHWRIKNQFSHYCGPGLRMFGYDPMADEDLTGFMDMFDNSEYSFDNEAEIKTLESIVDELPPLLYRFKDGIRFDDLYKLVANNTPATSDHIKEGICQLQQVKELDVRGPDGGRKYKANRIKNHDIIRLPQQRTFDFNKANEKSEFEYL